MEEQNTPEKNTEEQTPQTAQPEEIGEGTQGEEAGAQKKSLPTKLIAGVVGVLALAGAGYWAISSGTLDLQSLVQNNGSSAAYVATVNGEGIEKRLVDLQFAQAQQSYEAQGTQVGQEQAAQLRDQIVQDLIDQEVLVQHAKEQGIQAEDQAVEQQYQQIVSQFENEEAFEAELSAQNVTVEDVRDSVNRQIVIQELIDQQTAENPVEVSQEEMQQAYDQAAQGSSELPAFEEVQPQIEQSLRQQKISQLMQQLITQLRSEASIEILS